METWRPLFGNDAYEASSLGQIRGVGPRTRRRVLCHDIDNGGYARVRLSPNMARHHMVHRLVWEAFNGPIPEDLEINHKNGIKTDNRPDNLETISHHANYRHARHIGLIKPENFQPPSLFGSANPSAKLTIENVRSIRLLRENGMNAQAIARQLGLKYRTVQHVAAGTYWSKVK